jgi:hypothetical protein
MEYYGIEVNHIGSEKWHNIGKLYPSFEIANSVKEAIELNNKLLYENGSKWRLFKLQRL